MYFILIGLFFISVQSIEYPKKREHEAPFFYCAKALELNIQI